FFQAEDGIRAFHVTGVQTCALPICCSTARPRVSARPAEWRRSASPRCGNPMRIARTFTRHTLACETKTRGKKMNSRLKKTALIRSEERRVGKERDRRAEPEQGAQQR